MTDATLDDGPALRDKIQADLQMDGEWIVRTERALTWWGEPIPITYLVSAPLMIGGDPSVNVVATTTVLTDVTAPSDQVLALVALANQYASAASLIWLEDERRVASVMAWHSYADVAARTSFEIGRSIASYTEVNARLGAWQEALGGELYAPAHPESGVRKDWDDMKNLVEREIVPAGRGANRWADFDFESLARQLTAAGIGISTGVLAVSPWSSLSPATRTRSGCAWRRARAATPITRGTKHSMNGSGRPRRWRSLRAWSIRSSVKVWREGCGSRGKSTAPKPSNSPTPSTSRVPGSMYLFQSLGALTQVRTTR